MASAVVGEDKARLPKKKLCFPEETHSGIVMYLQMAVNKIGNAIEDFRAKNYDVFDKAPKGYFF